MPKVNMVELLKKAKEGRIQEEIQNGICTKFKN